MSLRRKLLYGGSGVPWSPYMLGRSLLAEWWCADDHAVPALMTDDGDGLISSWKGRINGTNLTGTTTARPTWGATSFNGLPGVTADGVANGLSLTGVPSYFPTAALPSEIWVVCQDTGSGATTRVIGGYGVGATGRAIRVLNSPALISAIGDSTSIFDTSFPAGGSYVMGAIFTGTELLARCNGRAFSSSAALVPNTSTTRVRMFSNIGGSLSNLWQGPVRHFLITRAMTAAQRLLLEGFLAWDSGLQSLLPDGHIFKYARP